MTLAIVTGISASGASDFAEAATRGLDGAVFYKLGSRMLQIARDLRRPLTTEKILDANPDTLAFLRSTALEQILTEAETPLSEGRHVVLAAHATFRWRKYLDPAFGLGYAERLVATASEADQNVIFVNVVDSIPRNWTKLQESRQWKDRLEFEEVLLWRDEEALVTRMLAEYAGKEYFQIGREEPEDTLRRLIADPKAPKAYFSFPITAFREDPDRLDQARLFGERLKETLITFDPLSVRDKRWASGTIDEDFADCPINPSDISDRAHGYIDHQTVARDYQFIDQADLVAVWYDTNKVSFGVASEIFHGFTSGKDVFAFHPLRASPFLTFYVTKKFDDQGVMLEALQGYEPLRPE